MFQILGVAIVIGIFSYEYLVPEAKKSNTSKITIIKHVLLITLVLCISWILELYVHEIVAHALGVDLDGLFHNFT